jgi:putative endonuclease
MSGPEHWWVYIIRCQDGALYTGITNHLVNRWRAHTSGKGGAKFFRSRSAERIIYIEYPHNRSSASQREYAIKQLSRPQKLQLIEQWTSSLKQ